MKTILLEKIIWKFPIFKKMKIFNMKIFVPLKNEKYFIKVKIFSYYKISNIFFLIFKKIFFVEKFWIIKKIGSLNRCEILWRIHFSHSWIDLRSSGNKHQFPGKSVFLQEFITLRRWKSLSGSGIEFLIWLKKKFMSIRPRSPEIGRFCDLNHGLQREFIILHYKADLLFQRF